MAWTWRKAVVGRTTPEEDVLALEVATDEAERVDGEQQLCDIEPDRNDKQAASGRR